MGMQVGESKGGAMAEMKRRSANRHFAGAADHFHGYHPADPEGDGYSGARSRIPTRSRIRNLRIRRWLFRC